MTIDEAKKNLETLLNDPDFYCDPKTRMSISLLLAENKRLNARLSDKLPNGGFRVHGIKNSMQPTFENDTE